MPEEKKNKKNKKLSSESKGKKSELQSDGHDTFTEEKIPVRLYEFYKTHIIPELSKKLGYKNPLQVPRLEKICINVGVGAATQDPKIIDVVIKDLENIAGQKAVVTKAKKSVSNFKLREGMKIGCMVTLRRARMYEFLDKLINLSIPRIRDFRGVSDRSFDGRGNYTMGVKEHIIFPEVDVDSVNRIFGMDITIVTTAKTDNEARELLREFGMPFVKKEN